MNDPAISKATSHFASYVLAAAVDTTGAFSPCPTLYADCNPIRFERLDCVFVFGQIEERLSIQIMMARLPPNHWLFCFDDSVWRLKGMQFRYSLGNPISASDSSIPNSIRSMEEGPFDRLRSTSCWQAEQSLTFRLTLHNGVDMAVTSSVGPN